MSEQIDIIKDSLTIDGNIEFRISHDPNTGKTVFGQNGGEEAQIVALSIVKAMLQKTIEIDNENRKNKKYSRTRREREIATSAYQLIDRTMQAMLPRIIEVNTKRAEEEEAKSKGIILLK